MDFVRYRNATRDMNERYPDATVNDVGQDDVCIICREPMIPCERPGPNGPVRTGIPDRLRPKKLPCGHVLHFSCLRSWLERQQNCPTCRRPVVVSLRNHHRNGDQQAAGRNGGDALPRARIYQFGPLRIGFGAGRADMIQNLQQQFNRADALQQPGNGQPAAPPPAGHHFGLGIGFGRPTEARNIQQSANNAVQLQNQLLQIEEQITQEINSLRVTAEQLQLVRLLQAELQRLRTVRTTTTNAASSPGISPTNAAPANIVPANVVTINSVPANAAGAGGSSRSSPSVTVPSSSFARDLRAPTLRAGDARLPEGLTLPPGWTLFPLQTTTDVAASNRAPLSSTDTLSSHSPTTTTTPTMSTTPAESSLRRDSDRGESIGARSLQGQRQEPAESQDGIPSEKPSELPVAENGEPSTAGKAEQDKDHDESSSSSCEKGKGRTVTVEDAPEYAEEGT